MVGLAKHRLQSLPQKSPSSSRRRRRKLRSPVRRRGIRLLRTKKITEIRTGRNTEAKFKVKSIKFKYYFENEAYNNPSENRRVV